MFRSPLVIPLIVVGAQFMHRRRGHCARASLHGGVIARGPGQVVFYRLPPRPVPN